jgi:ketosteroid isomerase-like protein
MALPHERRDESRDTLRTVSEANVQRLRQGYESLNRGDFDEAVSIIHPDFEFWPPGGQPPYRGVASFRKWMELDAFAEQTYDRLKFVISGNKILVEHRFRARGAGSGIEMEVQSFSVWTFDEDDRAIRLQGYLENEKAKAFEAAGVSE